MTYRHVPMACSRLPALNVQEAVAETPFVQRERNQLMKRCRLGDRASRAVSFGAARRGTSRWAFSTSSAASAAGPGRPCASRWAAGPRAPRRRSGRRQWAASAYGRRCRRRWVRCFSTSEHGRDYRIGYGLGVLDREGLKFDLGVDAQRRESPGCSIARIWGSSAGPRWGGRQCGGPRELKQHFPKSET